MGLAVVFSLNSAIRTRPNRSHSTDTAASAVVAANTHIHTQAETNTLNDTQSN